MEQARVRCLGETMKNQPVQYIGGMRLTCKDKFVQACMGTSKAD